VQQPCLYDPRHKKRGLIEGYVRGLERLLGLAISSDPGFETLVTSIFNNRRDSSIPIELPAHGWLIKEDGETLIESWKNSSIASDIEGLLTTLEALEAKGWTRTQTIKPPSAPVDNQVPSPADQDVPVGGRTPNLTNSEALKQFEIQGYDLARSQAAHLQPDMIYDQSEQRYSDAVPTSVEMESYFLSFDKHLAASAATQQQELSPLSELAHPPPAVPQELPERAAKLLDAHFTFTHCWLPIVGRHDILRVSFQYKQTSQNMSAASKGAGQLAALWALLAYENSYEPDALDPTSMENRNNSETTNGNMYQIARTLIPSEELQFEVGHVQALLLLALLNARCAKWTTAWLLVGQAVRVAIDLGLHQLPVSSQHLTSGTEGTSSARQLYVFLGCFTLDTFISARLGRMPYLRTDALDSMKLLNEDCAEEWEPWTNHLDSGSNMSREYRRSPSFITTTFNRLVEVIKVLNDLLCDSSGGSEWRRRCASYHGRLLKIMDQCCKTYLPDWTGHPMPHQAILHLMHTSALAYLRSRTLQKQALAIFEAEPNPRKLSGPEHLISHLWKCSVSLGLKRMPPLVEYSASLALQGLKAINFASRRETEEDLHWKESLYNVVSGGSGPAFEQLRTGIWSMEDESTGQVQYKTSTSTGSSICGEQNAGHDAHDKGNRAKIHPLSSTSELGARGSRHDLASSLGRAADVSQKSPYLRTEINAPNEIPSVTAQLSTYSAPNSESDQRLNSRCVDQGRSQLLECSSDALDLNSMGVQGKSASTSLTPTLGDMDDVFLGLAHLDTTEWQVDCSSFLLLVIRSITDKLLQVRRLGLSASGPWIYRYRNLPGFL
jgi:hypothetical protein